MGEIENLYEETYEEKWQEIENRIEDEDIDQVMELAFELCPFCDEAMYSGVGSVNTDGCNCKPTCKIDPTICGSKESLLEQLTHFCGNNEEKLKIAGQIIEEIKNRM